MPPEIEIVRNMLQQHSSLSPELFDDKNMLLPHIRKKLIYVADYMQDVYLPCFPEARLKDLMLVGSSCGYNYNLNGDLDFFVIIDKIFPDKPHIEASILSEFALILNRQGWKANIYNHPLDIAIMEEANIKSKCHNNYSVMRNEWNSAPVYREYEFTAEDLYEEFLKEVEKINKFADSLEKDKFMYLSPTGCEMMQKYLQKQRDEAYDYDIDYEYSIKYNVYRLFKRFKVISHFHKYITESINRLRENYDRKDN